MFRTPVITLGGSLLEAENGTLCLQLSSLCFRTPSFSSVTNSNCVDLPACFFLKMNHPMPFSLSFIQRMGTATGGFSLQNCVSGLGSIHPHCDPKYKLKPQFTL